ncbi:MAG TPA: hypothetical protein VFB22_14905 [Candidatus Baltobacteraceae bacterium]|nr:hypothetical protein [Candidatus Baltobacteraceae bacterium]
MTARRAGAATAAIAIAASLVVAVREPARAAALCATPGRDGSSTISGIVDSYFPGAASVAAGATTISLSAHASGDADVAIASGDLLLVIQMQGATINTSNSSSYGDGSGSGSGATAVTAGTYEYVVAQSAVATSGGTVTIKGAGAGGGLLHAYSAGTNQHFQVVRVPQYNAPTIGSALVPLGWNGTAGGVLAFDAQNLVSGNGATIGADYLGFRGGGARQLSGSASGTAGAWASSNSISAHGEKGEGIAGTPAYTFVSTSASEPGSGTESGSGTADGYTGGDMGRGAPGNAGGGGSDSDPSANDQNSGGGGGGNGGAGGVGGKTYSSDVADGGRGGTLTASSTAAVMGGGGGAGVRNNSSGSMSSGGSGGAIVMIRAAGVTGGLTVSANGGMGVEPDNDGGGGGGAGGTIVITAISTLSGVSARANGANGTDADELNSGGNAHGPGGGGGGGVIVQSGGVSTSVTGGQPGITDGSPDPNANYGAAAGGTGQTFTLSPSSVPGASSGAECGSSSTSGLLIGPVGMPNATGSYDGNVATTNNDDFVEKSFAPAGFTAINSSTTPGTPNGNTYTSAVTGIAVRHQYHNYSSSTVYAIFYAQAPSGWTVGVYADSSGSLGSEITGSASSNTYTTSTSYPVTVAAGADGYVWTVYAAPSGVQAYNRFDALLAIIDLYTTSDNNEVHDELYSGYVVETKSYTITATNCSGSPPAGSWCPGATLKYTIDVRNIAIAANGTTPASATLTASTLAVTDDGSNTNSWAKDGGYLNSPGTSSTGTAPTSVTYYYNSSSSTTFPANYSTTNKVFKIAAAWSSMTAGQTCQLSFNAIQF